jgi:hypothetical protein
MPRYELNKLGGGIGIFTRADERRNIYPNPTLADERVARHRTYDQMFAYYSNTAFDDVAKWARYRLNYSLYRFTRPIFNPFTRVVDFYAEHTYPGTLSEKSKLSNGKTSAIPFDNDTPEEIRVGAAQLWQWSNWQTNNNIMVQHGAMTGNVAVDIIDDFRSGKLRWKVYFPTMVRDIVVDDYGNVQAVVFEYMTSDPNVNGGRPFLYGKEVQKDFIAYYKDGKPFDFGDGAIIANPYGFVPVVWAKHIDIGKTYGVPAMRSSIGKIDELNSIVSHTADHIHKQIESPRIIWSNGDVKPMFGSDPDYSAYDNRQQQILLKGSIGGTTDTLVGNLDPQAIIPLIEKMTAEIERDYIEITMYEKLRDQNIVTAPGAARLMGDVERKMARPAKNYDKANEKLIQMSLAIAGFRANNGDWGSNLTPQQRKFLPFDLTSYQKGELDLTIMERELTPQTSREEADELVVRANAVAALADVIPDEEKFRILGKREEDIPELVAKIQTERKAKADEEIRKAKESHPPAAPAPAAKPNKP